MELMTGRDFIRAIFVDRTEVPEIPKDLREHILSVVATADHTKKGTD